MVIVPFQIKYNLKRVDMQNPLESIGEFPKCDFKTAESFFRRKIRGKTTHIYAGSSKFDLIRLSDRSRVGNFNVLSHRRIFSYM